MTFQVNHLPSNVKTYFLWKKFSLKNNQKKKKKNQNVVYCSRDWLLNLSHYGKIFLRQKCLKRLSLHHYIKDDLSKWYFKFSVYFKVVLRLWGIINLIPFLIMVHIWILKQKKWWANLGLLIIINRTGPSCSKLTTSLVNDSLKFKSSDTQICWNFLLKKCE